MAPLDWSECPAVESVSEKMSGVWVLKGTRMPASVIFENLEAGASIDDIIRFEAYLPPQLAEWLLERIEKGVFLDPREAVFVLLGEYEDLEPHTDLRQELLRRRLDAAINDPRPSIPAEQVVIELREKMAAPRPEAAVWTRVPP